MEIGTTENTMAGKTLKAFEKLCRYCQAEKFKGWDPYDGLNSKVFSSIPLLKKSGFLRLVMIQGFKRSPFNLRRMFMVPKEYNAKGIGLFLQGYCNLYETVHAHPFMAGYLGDEEELISRIDELAGILIGLKSEGYSGACWGYNFDWQARLEFLFPKNTPTVVATAFCATALEDAARITGNGKYLDVALSSSRFVLNDLHRTEFEGGFLFSYSPLEGNNTVFNASLLGSKLLGMCYAHTGDRECLDAAQASVRACCRAQADDGSWVYGTSPVQGWIDSFHTGYNLDALVCYGETTGDKSFDGNMERGFEFYVNNFFEPDGTPKYYHDMTYPIDIHCPGQLFVTLSRLHRFDGKCRDLADKVMNWTIANMQDEKGYFYYQLKKGVSSKIPYMRWSNAFMFNAMSHYMLEASKNGAYDFVK